MGAEPDALGTAADHQQAGCKKIPAKLIALGGIGQIEGAHQAPAPGVAGGLWEFKAEGLQSEAEFFSSAPGVFHQRFLVDDPQDMRKTDHVDQVAAEGRVEAAGLPEDIVFHLVHPC